MERVTASYDAKVLYPELAQGSTKIWYARYSRDLGVGYEWCKKQNCLPDVNHIEKTHAYIGSIDCVNLERIFELLQGEFWSPNGEAYDLIEATDTHTSMSVGDIIQTEDGFYMVDRLGFIKI